MAKKIVSELVTDLEVLQDRADEIDADSDNKQVKKIIKKLKDFLVANPECPGISAPQLGFKHRIICINFNKDIRAFINPVIGKTEGIHLVREKTPSIPNKEFIIPRNDTIIAVYQNAMGKPESNKFEGTASEVFQQLVSILDGVLPHEYGLEVTPDFDEATQEERDEVLEWYVNYLKSLNAQVEKEIQEDPELKKIKDAADFMTKVQLGEIELDYSDAKPVIPTNQIKQNVRKQEMNSFVRSLK